MDPDRSARPTSETLVSGQGLAPLSFPQKRLWFIDRLTPGNPVYHSSASFRVSGEFDPARLGRALDALVERHEILRTSFVVHAGQPAQVVTSVKGVPLPLDDLSALPRLEQERAVAALARKEQQRPFDLQQGPLLRCRVFQLAEREHVVLFTLHHIISDAWSLGVLCEELSLFYRGDLPPPLACQYADFARWQTTLPTDLVDRELIAWKTQLAGAPPVTSLPTDRPRPAEQRFCGQHHPVSFDAATTSALKQLSQRGRCSLYVTLMALFQTLLYRYSGDPDQVVGSPVANRSRAEFEGLIGCFVNLWPIRTSLLGAPSFLELLGRVRGAVMAAFANPHVPFERLVEELQPVRSLSHAPLVQVSFAFQNVPRRALELPRAVVTSWPLESGSSKFDLTLFLEERDGGLSGTIEYDTDLFDAGTIARMAGHLQVLAGGVVARPEQSISRLPLLTEGELQQLDAWNNTAAEFPRHLCVHQLFEAEAAAAPGKVAVEGGGAQLTYRELDRRANQLAHALRRHGVGPDVPVGIYLERSIEMVVAIFGVLKAGGAYVPLDPTQPRDRLALMLADVSAPVLVTRQKWRGRLDHPRQLCVDEPLDQEPADAGPAVAVTPRHLVYVLYTSGSTGRPKGVLVPHEGVVNYLHFAKARYRPESGRGAPVHSSLGFDLTVTSLLLPLVSGRTVTLVPEAPGVDALLQVLESGAPFSLVKITPAHLQALALAASPEALAGRSHAFVIGGDGLYYQDLAAWRAHAPGTRLINEYGPTETVVGCSVYEVGEGDGSTGPVPIGRPISNMELHVLDGAGEKLPVGVPGELFIGGVGLARGYLHQPDLTAERFLSHPAGRGGRLYRTGDLVRRLPDGQLEWLGRQDLQVKLRGFRVELGEIESALAQHPAVGNCVARIREDPPGTPGAPGDRRLVAYLVPRGDAPSAAELRDFLAPKLPEYMIPSAFLFLSAIPVSANGKVDVGALPRPAAELAPWRPARTDEERTLARLWAETLSVPRIGLDDNFFALGGHSLLALHLLQRVRETFGVELSLPALFRSPTLLAMIEQLKGASRQAAGQAASGTIPRVDRNDRLPLSRDQARMWKTVHQRPENQISTLLRLTGPLKLDVLTRALNEIVRRHEVLRTTFHREPDGSARVTIAPSLTLEVPEVDLEAETHRQDVLGERTQAETAALFDLERGPLLRMRSFRLGKEERVLSLTMHHLIGDATSLDLFFHELSTLYHAFLAGHPSPLAELPIQYVDYAAWQRAFLAGPAWATQADHWRSQLGSGPAALALPTDRPPSADETLAEDREELLLGSDLAAALEALARREGCTMYMLLLAAFATVLHRESGQEEFFIGTPINTRSHLQTSGLIGYFSNHLTLRMDFTGAPSFSELVGRVRDVVSGALHHRDLPLLEAFPDLPLERRLYQVRFTYLPRTRIALPGVSARPLTRQRRKAWFDVALYVTEREDGLNAVVRYKSDRFDPPTIRRLLQRLADVLKAANGPKGDPP
jgi:amino acid adenylation domain-containing protein